MSARWALEHKLWGFVKQHNLLQQKIVIACSGGADSVALLRAFAAIRPRENLVVAHIHHGPGNTQYRDEALAFLKSLSEKLQLTFEAKKYEGPALKSEKQLRDVRRGFLEEIRTNHQADLIATAHHRRDLAETRVIRLLRGTGPEGFRAILPLRKPWLRPFLEDSPHELRKYLADLGQDFLEDPSNAEVQPLRNWLRHVWFPQLEDRQPGGVEALARSLENLAMAQASVPSLQQPKIPRVQWEVSSQNERLKLLAQCLRSAGQIEMTRGQLLEIERRLSSRQKVFSFRLGECLWSVDPHQIQTIRQGPKSSS